MLSRLSMAAAFCLLAGALLAACGTKIKNLDSRGTDVIAFGDSITHGTGANAGEDYPSVMGQLLHRGIINAGVPGDTTADGLARMEADVFTKNPKLVYIEFGGNDFLKGVAFKDSVSNMEKIVRMVQARGAMAVVVSIGGVPQMRPYAREFERIAKENGAIFVDGLLDGILTDPTLKSDEIHPNAAGYKIVAQRLAEQTGKYLK